VVVWSRRNAKQESSLIPAYKEKTKSFGMDTEFRDKTIDTSKQQQTAEILKGIQMREFT
jgi:hypothetical protein